jgi:ubiquinone/menaquinone biosynthesis C-methylase UbiE
LQEVCKLILPQILNDIINKEKLKVRDSGMPAEKMWASFFDVDLIVSELQINTEINDLVEVGCGYGTFTILAAKIITGKLFAFDIEKEMLDSVNLKLASNHIGNVILEKRDIITQTTGLEDNTIDYVMLFNILHHDTPVDFFNEAFRILKPKGKVGILHWRSDILTPRGPDLRIRPKPEQILQWVDRLKFNISKEPVIIEPYHYGLVISKL